MKTLYPLLLEPVYKDYLWGGARIPRIYGRDAVPEICAESWEVADRPEGMSTVTNGSLKGEPLEELVRDFGSKLVGTAAPAGPFPLLIKLIDAKRRLSVQVHPDDDSAARHGGEAKTEMWYVLDAEADATVFAGMIPGVAEPGLRAAIESGTLEQLLVRTAAVPGEAIYIPGGCLHAIGEGCLLLEVQQNSNTTYRVYDWGRLGKDGRPRELHVEQAMRAIRWESQPPVPIHPAPEEGSNTALIVESPYFRLIRTELRGRERRKLDGRTFHVLFTAHGACSVTAGGETTEVPFGASCLLPAAVEEYAVEAGSDDAQILTISLV